MKDTATIEKRVDLMLIEEDRRYPEMWSYIHYSKAKPLGLRQGDVVRVTMDGKPLDGLLVVDEYVTWRDDKNRGYAGFRLTNRA